MDSIPTSSWSRKLDAQEPSSSVHTFSRPPIVEALGLLPIAYRVGSYIHNERSRGSEPIFDLSGLCLEPPKPGPHAGVPLGGLGGGSIGRGFRGDFRRWSLEPGRYAHRVIAADAFSLRVKRGNQIFATVLSTQKCSEASALGSWDWKLPANCGTYHALYPRSWTVYENPVPDITVIIEQVSPFLPGSYSEASLPCAVFQVEVINTSTTQGAEASVMFSFQNGYGGGNSCTACGTSSSNECCTCSSSGSERATANTSAWDAAGGLTHSAFSVDDTTSPAASPVHTGDRSSNVAGSWSGEVRGVCMTHPSASPASAVNQHCARCAQRNPLAPRGQSMDRTPALSPAADTTTQSTASTPAVPDSPLLDHQTGNFCPDCAGGLGSFAIAARIPSSATPQTDTGKKNENVSVLSTCAQFVTEAVAPAVSFPILSYLCGSRKQSDRGAEHTIVHAQDDNQSDTNTDISSARALWESFTTSGDIKDIDMQTTASGREKNVSRAGTRVGGAVCLRQWLDPDPINNADRIATNSKMFSFSLSWDNPFVRFGSSGSKATDSRVPSAPQSRYTPVADPATGMLLPRYYTRFLGTTGLASPSIAAFALSQVHDWCLRIAAWQAHTLQQSSKATVTGAGAQDGKGESSYYDHQLFNELYFLVDGGTVWTDSTVGGSNQQGRRQDQLQPADDDHQVRSNQWCGLGASTSASSDDDLLVPLTDRGEYDQARGFGTSSVGLSSVQLQAHLSGLSWTHLRSILRAMQAHDLLAQEATGEQQIVGQFLYLEGHEYLMYNTYDVHFYASFALLVLWPQLELSLQRDFVTAVAAADPTTRVMMGTGDVRPRKIQGVVPHDLGSPSEAPWARTNAYNFQDVSRWKDLGPKFVLQIYRDYHHIHSTGTVTDKARMGRFLTEVYPVLLTVMRSTQAFDTDGDGMIENSGFPDQTYDIWTATGVHAYCGGLWITACEAMCSVASSQQDHTTAGLYRDLAGRARQVYIAKLWNGRYLNYDSSSSTHHDSIMADMLAGQWYARACGLPPLLSPGAALSCYRAIYQHNVVDFGEGRLLGAVNGMRPPPEYDTRVGKLAGIPSSAGPSSPTPSDEGDATSRLPPLSAPIVASPVSIARVDSSCMQSREVWTGTTYALAAGMIQEAMYVEDDPHSHISPIPTSLSPLDGITTTESGGTPTSPATPTGPTDPSGQANLTARERAELLRMAHRTAQGIHDAGWQDFGYWFATPEGWERNGNYRSLGYMRALSIWAMQFAKSQNA